MRKGAWQIVQLPQVEAALVAMDPNDGAIRALVGGFDFNRNKFNHATQAYRQPGSSFKPFIYSAALEKGFTAATMINDAPLVIDAAETGSVPWEPKNFDGTFDGPIRLRTALTKSKNLVSIRILQAITPAVRPGLHHPFRLRPQAASALPDDGAGRRARSPRWRWRRATRCSPTAATGWRRISLRGRGRERAGAGQGRAGAGRRRRSAQRSIAATHS